MDLLADRAGWTLEHCSIASALDVIGNRVSLLLIREAFLGTRRFDDFASRVGVSESTTAARLSELAAAGILERTPYREPGQRERHEYRLTPKGRSLNVVITALRDWGDAWTTGGAGPSLHALHRDCGEVVHAEVRCDAGHLVRGGETELRAGAAVPTRRQHPARRASGLSKEKPAC